MEKQLSELPESEQKAFKEGFLKGFYSEGSLYEYELEKENPYPKGSKEYEKFKEGYYTNLI